MKIIQLQSKDYPLLRWKNGFGVTRELVRFPIESIQYRIRLSRAQVDTASPFSRFEGYDRFIAVVKGNGFIMDLPDRKCTVVHPYELFTFPGEAPVECSLVDGPVEDFNIFIQRDCVEASAWTQYGSALCDAHDIAPCHLFIVHCIVGWQRLRVGDVVQIELRAEDTCVLDFEGELCPTMQFACVEGEGAISCVSARFH